MYSDSGRRYQRILFISAVVLFACPGVKGASVIIGSDVDRTHIPFGNQDFGRNSAYQQLVSSSVFGGTPVRITGLRFFAYGTIFDVDVQYFNQEIFLSTAPTTVQLSGATFEANRGSDFTRVFGPSTYTVSFDGFLTGPNGCPSTCDKTTLDIAVVPFNYNPALGDLLIEVPGPGAAHFSEDDLFFRSGPSPFLSSLDNLGGVFHQPQVFTNYGLKTEIFFTPVPVPPAFTMLAIGLAGLGRSMRRRDTLAKH